jgi:hypothetical protein
MAAAQIALPCSWNSAWLRRHRFGDRHRPNPKLAVPVQQLLDHFGRKLNLGVGIAAVGGMAGDVFVTCAVENRHCWVGNYRPNRLFGEHKPRPEES